MAGGFERSRARFNCLWEALQASFKLQKSVFGVPCSVFDVPCSVFGVPCSVFGVPCSVFGFGFNRDYSVIPHRGSLQKK
jgi:hypothetical protein